jgi:hypothetical protein
MMLEEIGRTSNGPIEITDDPTTLKVIIDQMVKAMRAGKQSRERSLAITKLQEAEMWLDEALRRE